MSKKNNGTISLFLKSLSVFLVIFTIVGLFLINKDFIHFSSNNNEKSNSLKKDNANDLTTHKENSTVTSLDSQNEESETEKENINKINSPEAKSDLEYFVELHNLVDKTYVRGNWYVLIDTNLQHIESFDENDVVTLTWNSKSMEPTTYDFSFEYEEDNIGEYESFLMLNMEQAGSLTKINDDFFVEEIIDSNGNRNATYELNYIRQNNKISAAIKEELGKNNGKYWINLKYDENKIEFIRNVISKMEDKGFVVDYTPEYFVKAMNRFYGYKDYTFASSIPISDVFSIMYISNPSVK